MHVDLLSHAPGEKAALCLDDQPDTLDVEKNAVRKVGINTEILEQPWEYLDYIHEWLSKQHKKPEEERAESRCVLVVDVNLSGVTDIRELQDHAEFVKALPDNRDLLDTYGGRRAGVVLVEYVLRNDPHFQQLPIIIITGFSQEPAIQERIVKLERCSQRKTKFLEKATMLPPGQDGKRFRNAACDMLYDLRLLFMQRLAHFWELNEHQVCNALGLRSPDVRQVAPLFHRGCPTPTVDTDQRVRMLYAVRDNLSNLFRDRKVELDWLNTKNKDLDGDSPLDMLCNGQYGRLARVKSYVDMICGV